MSKPTIAMDEFFKLPEIIECQATQMTVAFFSKEHKDAAIKIREIAAQYGAGQYFNDVEEDYKL